MPALDFPANPTNGQSYSGYTYNSTTGAWLANSAAVSPVTMSDSVPPNPTSGDMWFNTSDATMYLYYNDGSSSQWVEARAPITSDGYYSPNYIINGAFDIWQRGTTFTNVATQTLHADRWKVTSSVLTGTVTQSIDTPNTGFKYSAQLSPYSNGTPGEFAMRQLFEIQHIRGIAGKTVTVSFWVKCSKTSLKIRLEPYSATGATDTTQLVSVDSGVWTRVSKTFTNFVGVTAWTASDTTAGLSMDIGFADNTAMTTSDYLRITGVQLEEGSVATPFRRNANSIQGELAACQRYFYRIGQTVVDESPFGPIALGANYNTGSARIFLNLPVSMRTVSPSFSYTGTFSVGTGTYLSLVPDRQNRNTIMFIVQGSGFVSGGATALYGNGGSVGYVDISAEL